MSKCPLKIASESQVKIDFDWIMHAKNSSFLIFSICFLLFSIISVFVFKLKGFFLFNIILVNFFTSFLISFLIYERNIQNIFSTLNRTTSKCIPKYGFFRLLLDIIIRKNILLRNMDIERMRKLGDIYIMFMGYRPAIVITSSELAREVSKEPDIYIKSNPIDLNMPYFYKWVGNNNIVLSNGDDWKRLREIIHKQLNSTNIYFPTMCNKAFELTENIKKTIKHGLKSEVFLNRWLKAFSLDIAGETLFGFNFNHLKEISNSAIDAMDYIISEIFNPLRISFPLINKLPTKTNKKLDKSIHYIDKLVSTMREKYAHNSICGSNNLLKMLINNNKNEKLTDDELRNNIITLVLSSYETTQVSLGGVLFHLAKYSGYQKLIRKEFFKLFSDFNEEMKNPGNKAFEKFQKFELLDNFILESLRVYSPLANQNSRTVSQDTKLGGYNIKSGVSLIINIHAIHMNDSSWNEPNVFNPQRFSKKSRPDKFAFLPFGAGPRLCSGRSFTLLEQKIAIGCLLMKFKISLPNDSYNIPIKRASFTGIPESSFKLLFELL